MMDHGSEAAEHLAGSERVQDSKDEEPVEYYDWYPWARDILHDDLEDTPDQDDYLGEFEDLIQIGEILGGSRWIGLEAGGRTTDDGMSEVRELPDGRYVGERGSRIPIKPKGGAHIPWSGQH